MKKTKYLLYQIMNPSYTIIIKRYHVKYEELREIFRIMELIHKNNIFYETNNIEYDNYLMFCSLCSIKDKQYLKYLDENLMDFCVSHYSKIDNAITLLSILKNYIDYDKKGDFIFVYMSNVLWYNYNIDKDKIKDINNFKYFIEQLFIVKNSIDSKNDYYGDNYNNFLRFVLFYASYIYMNQYKYDIELFIDGIKMLMDERYYCHLLLNGAFDDKEKDVHLKIQMFFINEIINTINNKKSK